MTSSWVKTGRQGVPVHKKQEKKKTRLHVEISIHGLKIESRRVVMVLLAYVNNLHK